MSLTVNVKDNNIEQALRNLKKKLQREGLFKEMKLRKHYEKPCLKKAREKEENIRRSRKSERLRHSD
jgi:small subunit ribosomal protein S21